MSALIEAGELPDEYNGTMDSPLATAAALGNLECVKLLVEANSDTSGDRGIAAVGSAAWGGSVDILRYLLPRT